MEEVKQAANELEIANQQTEEVSETKTEVQGEQKEDITQTQAFARRLSEATTKAEMKARDELIAELYGEAHGIKTYAEYKEALKEQEIRKQYENKELPEDVINELVEGKKFREEYKAKEEAERTKAAKEKDQMDFLDYFKEVNGRYYDSEKDTIPQEVWDENNKGISLKKAYADYLKEQRIKQLESELEEVKKGSKAKQANAENASTATGSINENGSSNPTFFTQAQVENMTQAEVRKNWAAIIESQKQWK